MRNIHPAILAIVILIFTLFKASDFTMPYFWDEMGVFVNTVFYMLEHGISLMPGDVPPELSRGHPLLFTFLHSLAYAIFGNSPITGRSFELLMSIAILLLVYRLGVLLKSKTVGLLAAILLAVQPLFYAQAGLILPETMLTLFVLLSVYAYLKNNWIFYLLFCSLALWTKESAVVLPLAVLLTEWASAYFNNSSFKKTIQKSIVPVLPYCAFGIFLLIQKAQNGWYFFPYHMEHVSLNISAVIKKFLKFSEFLFISQGRWLLSLVMVWYIVRKISKQQWPIFDIKVKSILIFCLLVIGLLGFSSLNFYMNRYLLFAVPFIALLSALSIEYLLGKKPQIQILITIVLIIHPLLSIKTDRFNYDEDMSYTESIKVIKEAVPYLLENNFDNTVIAGNHPVVFALSDKRMGYTDKEFNISWGVNEHTEYCLYFNPQSTPMPENVLLKPLKTFNESYAEMTLYQVIDQ